MPEIELVGICGLAEGEKCHRDGLCKSRHPAPDRESALKGNIKGKFYICEMLELKRV